MKNKTTIQQHRELALTIPCIYCHAPIGQECKNTLTGQPLVKIAAHWQRLKTAQQKNHNADADIIPLPVNTPDDPEELF